MILAAKCLVILALSLVVMPGNVFASKPIASKKVCNASCAARCPCCISKAPTSDLPAPLAPTSQSRVSVEKNFNLLPVIVFLLAPTPQTISEQITPDFSLSSRSGAPLYQRHCIYLI